MVEGSLDLIVGTVWKNNAGRGVLEEGRPARNLLCRVLPL